MDRKAHVGKSEAEKDAYRNALKTSMPANPTFEEESGEFTDSPQPEESGSTLKSGVLKPYRKESNIPWKEIVIGIVVTLVGLFFTIITMDLNREVGVLEEKVCQFKENSGKIETRTDLVETNINNIKVDIEVLKKTKRDK